MALGFNRALNANTIKSLGVALRRAAVPIPRTQRAYAATNTRIPRGQPTPVIGTPAMRQAIARSLTALLKKGSVPIPRTPRPSVPGIQIHPFDKAAIDLGVVRPTFGPEVMAWHIRLAPLSRSGLEALIRYVPPIGQLAPSLLALVSDAGNEARGLHSRRTLAYDTAGWDDWFGGDDEPVPRDTPGGGGDSFPDRGGSLPLDPDPITFEDPTNPGSGWVDMPRPGDPNDFPDIGPLPFDPNADPNANGGGGAFQPGDFGEDPFETPSDFPGVPGSSDPVPGSSGTMDAGVYLQAQMNLAAWNRGVPGVCVPSDYGSSPSEFTGVPDDRSTSALASYQAWADSAKGENLRTDGVLDPATYESLKRTAAELLQGKQEPTATAGLGGSSGALLLVALGAAAFFMFKKKGAA